MKRKLLSLLVLLLTATTGAWAQEVTLLTTIENTGDNASFKSGSKTFDNIATVTFSGEVNNDDDIFGWFSIEERTLTVTAAEGYTITRVKFYNMSGSAFDEEAPFEAILVNDGGFVTKVNGTSIGAAGVTKIEVYGYAGTPEPASYNVTANLAGGAYWATFYTEAGNYQAPEGTQVFAVNLNTSTAKITMTEISDRIVKSGEGVVLKNTTTSSITMSKTETAPAGDYSGSSLTGTTAAMTGAAGNIYVLNNGTQGVGFYKLSSTGTIGANKAYLTYSGGGSSAPSFFGFDGNTTGIDATLVNSEKVNSVVYDLQGRRVAQPTKGLYIVNGKKVVIK